MLANHKLPITVVILTQNNETVIERAIKSVQFADQVLLIDENSSDDTEKAASKLGAEVIKNSAASFAEKRNLGLSQAKHDWIFYLDSDEEVSPELQMELKEIVDKNKAQVFAVTRRNYFLGKEMYVDQVERLFHKTKIIRWEGEVHEHAVIDGETQLVVHPLLHFTHTDISSMLAKTNEWSEIEADLRIKAHHPPVKWWRLVRIALTVWWNQIFHKKIWKYGREGWFEGYFQMVDKLVVYTKLWERQQ